MTTTSDTHRGMVDRFAERGRAAQLGLCIALLLALLLPSRPAGAETETSDKAKEYFGEWTITSNRKPSQSAMMLYEAARWNGRTGSFSESEARLGDNTCPAPSYTVHEIPEDQFRSGFHVAPGRLGLASGHVTVIEVRCHGTDWNAPGSILVVESKNRVLAYWEGIFFVLDRK